jgi:autotransporter-associated beta strand protein
LDVAGYSSYTGDTIVSNGTLKVSFEYNGTREGFAASRTFAVEDGATLEATLRNTTATRPAADILSAFPARAVVNIDASDVNKGYPRWADVSTSGFNGTVNFVSANALTTAGGFVAGASTFGSRDIAWGVTGAPDALTRVIDFEYNADANINLGSFNWPSENAGIFIKRSGKFNIGGRDEPSVMNGRFLTYGGVTLTVNHANDATLSLGSGFGAQLADGQSGNDPALVINMQKGTLVNDADLSGHTVNLSSGVTLAGGPNGVWPASTALPASYAIAANTVSTTCLNGLSVDFAHGATLALDLTGFDAADTSKVYTLLSADAIAALPPASLLASVNATLKGSKWLFSVRKDGDGASLVLKWAPTGTCLVFR